ncbi:hypothetical protein PHSY_000444 [Pseudozyma hubeiensis SY62]|uniref:Cytochrome b-c1 complex subunit 8 n=1 Tax=Pseudozyma hubeiensis (strain SY62) TaxID=1305764 RepID=R9NWK7_PSEHS|nr:hypothetical protein PHSY_000444 [Pseudozyma hubeiensis SY62]GAC92886.1 hypothetical protein PHSY_000444 [Pseudozyma hubeiensis SY62]
MQSHNRSLRNAFCLISSRRHSLHSTFSLNAMKGALHSYVFYGFKRIMQQAPYFVLPFGVGYGLIAWAKSKNAYYNSKAGHLAHGHDE